MKNKKILIVDDEKDVVDFLGDFLSRFNIKPIKATGGKSAIELFKLNKPKIVFLDIQMPDMDGFVVLKEILKISPKTKVFMITAKNDKESQRRAKEIGAFDYITKPIDLLALLKKIKKYIDKK